MSSTLSQLNARREAARQSQQQPLPANPSHQPTQPPTHQQPALYPPQSIHHQHSAPPSASSLNDISAISNYGGTATSFPVVTSQPDTANISMLSQVDESTGNISQLNTTVLNTNNHHGSNTYHQPPTTTMDARTRIATRPRVQPSSTTHNTSSATAEAPLDITRIEDKLKKLAPLPALDANTTTTSDDTDLDKLRTVVRKLELHRSAQPQRASLPPLAARTGAGNAIRVHHSPNKAPRPVVDDVQPTGVTIQPDVQDVYTVTDLSKLQEVIDMEQQYDPYTDFTTAASQPLVQPSSNAADELYVESRHTGEFVRVKVDPNDKQKVVYSTNIQNVETMLINAVNHTQSRIQLISLLSITLLVGVCLLQICVLYSNNNTNLQLLYAYSSIAYLVRQMISILVGLCAPISIWRLCLERNEKSQAGYYSAGATATTRLRNWAIAVSLFVAYLCTLVLTPLDDTFTYSPSIFAQQQGVYIEGWLASDIIIYLVLATIRFTCVALAWLCVTYRYVNIETVNLQQQRTIEELKERSSMAEQKSMAAEQQQQKMLFGLNQRTPTLAG